MLKFPRGNSSLTLLCFWFCIDVFAVELLVDIELEIESVETELFELLAKSEML